MFDLPVADWRSRKEYTSFRKTLLRQGFGMLQYSVYARYCPNEDSAATYRRRIRRALPPQGQVRLLSVTDRQFAKMEIHCSRTRVRSEQPPPQMLLF